VLAVQTSSALVLLTYASEPALSAVHPIGIHVPTTQSHKLGGELTKATVPCSDDVHLGKLDGAFARIVTSYAPRVLVLGCGDPCEEQPPLATITPPPATTRPARMSIFMFELLLFEASVAPEVLRVIRARSSDHENLSGPGRISDAASAIRANGRRSGAIVDGLGTPPPTPLTPTWNVDRLPCTVPKRRQLQVQQAVRDVTTTLTGQAKTSARAVRASVARATSLAGVRALSSGQPSLPAAAV
jgi:hypothetical protein